MIPQLNRALQYGGRLHTKELLQLHRVLLSGLITFDHHTRQFSVANTSDTVSTNGQAREEIDETLAKMLEFFNAHEGMQALENTALYSGDKAKKMTAFLTLNVLAFLGNGYRIEIPKPALPKQLWSISRDEARILAQKPNRDWSLFDYVKLKARVSYEMSKGNASKPRYLKEIEAKLQAYEELADRDILRLSPSTPLVKFFTRSSEVLYGQCMPRIPRQAELDQARENRRQFREQQRAEIERLREQQRAQAEQVRLENEAIRLRAEANRFFGELKSKQAEIAHSAHNQEADLRLLKRANLYANNAVRLNPALENICENVLEEIKAKLYQKYDSNIVFTSLYRQDLNGEINPVPSRIMLENPVAKRHSMIQPRVSPEGSPQNSPPNALRFALNKRQRAKARIQAQVETAPEQRILYPKVDYSDSEESEN